MQEKEAESSRIVSNFEINKSKNKVIIYINPKIFPVSVVNKTASFFNQNNWVTVDGSLDEEILVELRPKNERDLELLAREFNNKLLENSTDDIKVEKENPSLVAKIREVVKQFVLEEKGRISKQSIITIGAILAGIGIAGLSAESASASHFCNVGGSDGGGNGFGGDACEGAEGGTGCDGGGEACFSGNELINTPLGEKQMHEVAIGDELVSYDEGTDTFVKSVVGSVIIHDGKNGSMANFNKNMLVELSVKIDGKIHATKVTDNHPYFDAVSKVYRPLRDFKVGDRVKSVDGEGVIVEKVSIIDENSPVEKHNEIVYNLHMKEGPHNYIVNGAVVHNKEGKCFAAGTMIEMMNGTLKPIELLQLGDETKGGIVYSLYKSVKKNGLFYLNGIVVSGTHAVLEGNEWKRVRDSEKSVPYKINNPMLVYNFDCEEHRIFINEIIFADFKERDYEEPLQEEFLRISLQDLNKKKMFLEIPRL